MQWELIVALGLVIPIILFPVAYIWYINIGGVVVLLNERKKSAVAKWLFDFERKGIILWEKQDDRMRQDYMEQADSLVKLIKER